MLSDNSDACHTASHDVQSGILQSAGRTHFSVVKRNGLKRSVVKALFSSLQKPRNPSKIRLSWYAELLATNLGTVLSCIIPCYFVLFGNFGMSNSLCIIDTKLYTSDTKSSIFHQFLAVFYIGWNVKSTFKKQGEKQTSLVAKLQMHAKARAKRVNGAVAQPRTKKDRASSRRWKTLCFVV